uniref:RNA-binding protein EWS-like n=1 Tax=Tursiops truncatus TaxID=9739 RepID=A0A6J3QRT0_TURTR|nr:RNA-binding protein EWS-like [Tursiops truncatus]
MTKIFSYLGLNTCKAEKNSRLKACSHEASIWWYLQKTPEKTDTRYPLGRGRCLAGSEETPEERGQSARCPRPWPLAECGRPPWAGEEGSGVGTRGGGGTPPPSFAWDWGSAAGGAGPAAPGWARARMGGRGAERCAALRGAAGKGRGGQLWLGRAEGRWQNLRARWEAQRQGGRGARTAAAEERGDVWRPRVRPPPPPPAVDTAETAQPAGAPAATATLRAGGSVEAKMGASRSAFGKIRVNPSKQAQGPEKPQVCRTINPPLWL